MALLLDRMDPIAYWLQLLHWVEEQEVLVTVLVPGVALLLAVRAAGVGIHKEQAGQEPLGKVMPVELVEQHILMVAVAAELAKLVVVLTMLQILVRVVMA